MFDHQLTVALLAPAEQSQHTLSALAIELAEFLRGKSLGTVTVLPLAGGYQITATAPQRDGAGDPDPSEEGDEPAPPVPAETPEDDVLLRLGKRGVPITYRMIGGYKVPSLYEGLPQEKLDAITGLFSKKTDPMRVLLLGGWGGEVAAAIMAGAPKGSHVYSFRPLGEFTNNQVTEVDLVALNEMAGARTLLNLPDGGADADAIVLGPELQMAVADLEKLQHHLEKSGVLVGLDVTETLREFGAQVDDSGVWAISARKLARALAPKEPAHA